MPFPVSFIRALISASLIACLTIAPICAARCATTLCVPASTDNLANDCHHSHTPLRFRAHIHHPLSHSLRAQRELIFTTPRLNASSVSIESYVFSIAVPHLDVAMQSLAFGLPPSARTAIPRFFSPAPSPPLIPKTFAYSGPAFGGGPFPRAQFTFVTNKFVGKELL